MVKKAKKTRKTVSVKGYRRKDGTRVKGYSRKKGHMMLEGTLPKHPGHQTGRRLFVIPPESPGDKPTKIRRETFY